MVDRVSWLLPRAAEAPLERLAAQALRPAAAHAADLRRQPAGAVGRLRRRAAGAALWALWDLAGARVGYLRMALFHGPLELGAAALWIIEGRKA